MSACDAAIAEAEKHEIELKQQISLVTLSLTTSVAVPVKPIKVRDAVAKAINSSRMLPMSNIS